MSKEHRRGKEYSNGVKKKKRKEVDYCCEGCGRKIEGRRTQANPSVEMLEVHHDEPIALGGNRRSQPRVLCGPKTCHEFADRFVFDTGISFSQIEATLGTHPFEPYLEHFRRGRYRRAEGRVLRRLRNAG